MSPSTSGYSDAPQKQTSGNDVPIYTFDQLDAVQRCTLKERAMNLRDRLGRTDPIPAHREECVRFILEAQAALLGKTPTEEDFGTPVKRLEQADTQDKSPWPLSNLSSCAASPGRPRTTPEEPNTKLFRAGCNRRVITPADHFDNMGLAEGNPRENLGYGKRSIPVADHFDTMGTASGDAVGSHGHASDDFYANHGLEYGIGHGKRNILSPDHLEGIASPRK